MDSITEIKLGSKEYPKLLQEIPDAPKLLYARGNLELLQSPDVMAVVGTRKASAYGLSSTHKLVADIAHAGIVIVSGLARGIDAAAHKATLDVGGKTIAVLGGGVDDASIYPPEHKNLAGQIIKSGGLILSEYPSGSETYKGNFVARNRIVAGLSQAVLVIEAPVKSGALITAGLALDYNREVLALPGPITNPNSYGTNKLIADGAKIMLDAEDALEIFGKNVQQTLDLPENSDPISICLVKNGPLSLSEIIDISGLDASSVTQALTMLELEEKIIMSQDGKFLIK